MPHNVRTAAVKEVKSASEEQGMRPGAGGEREARGGHEGVEVVKYTEEVSVGPTAASFREP